MFLDQKATNQQGFMKSLGDHIVNIFLGILPHIPVFNNLKAFLMRSRGAHIGKRVKLLANIWIDRFNKIEIGDDVSLARGVIMISAGGIKIGNRTMIGYRTTILSATHLIPAGHEQIRFAGTKLKKVTINNDVWIGAGVTILPGISIGEGSVIGAGAVVTKDIPPFSVAVGIPAKVIKNR